MEVVLIYLVVLCFKNCLVFIYRLAQIHDEVRKNTCWVERFVFFFTCNKNIFIFLYKQKSR